MVATIILVEPHELLRCGTRHALEADSSLRVIGEAADGEAGLELIEREKPDLAIVELSLPRRSGFELIQRVVERVPKCRSIVLTHEAEPKRVAAAFRVGASGYLLKTDPPADIRSCLAMVARGATYRSTGLAPRPTNGAAAPALSQREVQVVKLISDGMTSKQVGAALGIAARTVEAHRVRIMGKLGIRKVTGLVRFAIREGYLAP